MPPGKDTAVFGIYRGAAQAENAVDSIVAAGFSHNNIPVLLSDVKAGAVLFSAHCHTSNEIYNAKNLLKATGAEDISSTGEKAVRI